jgi:hypothetical protein
MTIPVATLSFAEFLRLRRNEVAKLPESEFGGLAVSCMSRGGLSSRACPGVFSCPGIFSYTPFAAVNAALANTLKIHTTPIATPVTSIQVQTIGDRRAKPDSSQIAMTPLATDSTRTTA